MTTFSQLVDKMVLETKRPDLRPEIATYINQTLRELHMEPERGNIVHFRDNIKEDILLPGSQQGYYWPIPNPSTFQGIVGARYDNVFDNDGNPRWAKEMPIGRQMNDEEWFFYRAGPNVFFKGYGGAGCTISLSWYEYVKALKYFDVANRPAVYDEDTGWTYAPAYDVSATTRANAQNLTSNWLLLRWATVIEEGVRAKVYKRLSDTERARTSYSMYMMLRKGLYTGEIADVSGSW